MTVDDSTARWAMRPIDLGFGNAFTPHVLAPSAIPAMTDAAFAHEHPELAVLSAIAHSADSDADQSIAIAKVALDASHGLDEDRSLLYVDLILHLLPEAARRALRTMALSKYEFQSDFARRYFGAGRAEGRTEGKTEGKAEVVLRLLALRYGPLSEATQTRVRGHTGPQLDGIAERVLDAQTLEEALGGR